MALKTYLSSLAKAYHTTRLKLRRKPYKYVFLISHVRSGSSLFTHLLNTHPAICCYGETSIAYASRNDLDRLVVTVHGVLRKLSMKEAIVADKLLHNRLLIDHALLNERDVFPVFLLRDPMESLASMITNLAVPWYGDSSEESVQKLVDHYVQRLKTIKEYAMDFARPECSLFVTYDRMLSNPTRLFMMLGEILGIDKRLFSVNYKTLRTTGLWGLGDGSPNIMSGVIQSRKEIKKPKNLLPAQQVVIEEAYRNCYAALSKSFRVV